MDVQCANLIFTMMLAQAPAVPSGQPPLEINSAFDFLIKGGWAMIPIGLCSLVALAIIVERFMLVRKGRVVPRSVVERLRSLAHDRPRALEFARANRSPIANILAVAIKDANEPQELMEKHVEEAGGREATALRQRMRVLSALPQVSTMLGLLGTVFGMIKTFQAVAATSEALGKTEMLAQGIFEAWTCTAGGLLVAIPVLIAYHHLMGKIDTTVVEIDRVVVDWLDQQKARTRPSLQPLAELRRAALDGDTADPSPGSVAVAPG